jgi:integrase
MTDRGEAAMRTNKYGIRGLKGVQLKRGFVYFWTPPVSLQRRKIFRFTTLGTDFDDAVAKARELNSKLEAYRGVVNGVRPMLRTARPMTVGWLFQQFEVSPRFTRYAVRTRQDYSTAYRGLEIHMIDDHRMFGEIEIAQVTRKVAYTVYEQYVSRHGNDSANKAIGACQMPFNYGTLKIEGIDSNPFLQLGKRGSPPRRQRWSDQQLDLFIKKAEEMGYSSVGRCALMCNELVQRPGDILSLTWCAYRDREQAWFIRQSKRGAEVLVPSTERLRMALDIPRSQTLASVGSEFNSPFVCPTPTGKRWHRRNFTKTARRVARAAGLPDDLQIRDLRRTGATEAASAGATPLELMAVGGWTNQASIRPYLVQTLEQAATVQAKRDAYRRRNSGAADLFHLLNRTTPKVSCQNSAQRTLRRRHPTDPDA